MNIGDYRVLYEDPHTGARVGELMTAHGPVETPVFMPVGTQATVKTMSPDELQDDFQIILGNTYHLFLRPGTEIIEKHGGLHNFMRWDQAILTDSGGFQVWSLGKLNKITETGVHFQSHLDGSPLFLGPAEAMAIQKALASDIAMVFDECIPYPCEKDYAAKSVARTLDWARLCREQPRAEGQLVFGIGQGSVFEDLREECARGLVDLDFDGYAIGGVSVGEGPELIHKGIADSIPFFPKSKPRYVMGLGELDQIVEAIGQGADMFDCVMPTRVARHGMALTRKGRLNLKRADFKDDMRPIEAASTAYPAKFTRSYIRHLLHSGEMLGQRLLTWHNLDLYRRVIEDARAAIRAGCYKDFIEAFQKEYQTGAAADPDAV